MSNEERYLSIGLEVGQLAPEFILEGKQRLSLEDILLEGPLVLIVGENTNVTDHQLILVEHKDMVEIHQVNNHGGSFLKLLVLNNNLQSSTINNYNESAIIYIIDRKRLICYKKEVGNYRLADEIDEILAILNFIT